MSEAGEDEQKKPNGIRPRDVGGPFLGFFGGILAHRLAAGSLPTESLDWVIRNGATGLALVVLLAFGWAYVDERKDRRRSDARKDAKLEGLVERFASRLEVRDREMAPLLRKLTRVMAITAEVIRNRGTITDSELAEIEKGVTPEDPLPLPPSAFPPKMNPGPGAEEPKP